MIEIANVSFLRQRIGQEIAVSDWLEVTQARIDQFAEATGDRQWIHVDVSRAAAESPFLVLDQMAAVVERLKEEMNALAAGAKSRLRLRPG